MHIEHIVNGERVDPYDFYIKAGWTLDGAVHMKRARKKESLEIKSLISKHTLI